PEDDEASVNRIECLLKVARYSEGREFANQLDSPSSTPMRRCVMRFLVLASWALAGDVDARAREMDRFLERYYDWRQEAEKGRVWTWKFDGLIDVIRKSQVDAETKVLLLLLIDLQQGKATFPTLTSLSRTEIADAELRFKNHNLI